MPGYKATTLVSIIVKQNPSLCLQQRISHNINSSINDLLNGTFIYLDIKRHVCCLHILCIQTEHISVKNQSVFILLLFLILIKNRVRESMFLGAFNGNQVETMVTCL